MYSYGEQDREELFCRFTSFTTKMEGYPPIPMFSVGLLVGKNPFQDGAMLG